MFPFFFFWPFEIILGTDVPILGAYVCKAPVLTLNILFHENTPKKVDDVISYNIFLKQLFHEPEWALSQ